MFFRLFSASDGCSASAATQAWGASRECNILIYVTYGYSGIVISSQRGPAIPLSSLTVRENTSLTVLSGGNSVVIGHGIKDSHQHGVEILWFHGDVVCFASALWNIQNLCDKDVWGGESLFKHEMTFCAVSWRGRENTVLSWANTEFYHSYKTTISTYRVNSDTLQGILTLQVLKYENAAFLYSYMEHLISTWLHLMDLISLSCGMAQFVVTD